MKNLSRDELVSLLRGGDINARNALIERHVPLAISMAKGDDELLSILLYELVLAVDAFREKQRRSIEQEGHITGWIRGWFRCEITRTLSKRKKHALLDLQYWRMQRSLRVNAFEHIDQQDLIASLVRDDEERAVVEAALNDLNGRETAKLLGLTEVKVTRILNRLKARV